MRWPALYQPPPQSTSSAEERISVVFVQYGHRRMAYGQMRRMAMMRRYAGKIQTARAAGLFGKLVTRLPRERLGEPVIDEDRQRELLRKAVDFTVERRSNDELAA